MKKQILPLFLLAVISGVAATFLLMQQQPASNEKAPLFVDFAEQAADVSKIEMHNSAGVLFTAELVDGQWLAFVDGIATPYPADEEKLSGLMTTLLDAHRVEAKTGQADKYHRLGVSDIGEANSQATQLSVFARSGGKWQVLVGNHASTGNGTYVRVPGESQSWLLDTRIELPADGQAWLKQPVLALQEAQIQWIEKTGDNGWRVIPDAQGQWQLEAMPEDRQLKYNGILDSLVSNLVNLDFDELVNDSKQQSLSFDQASTIRLSLGDDKVIELTLLTLEQGHFLRVNAQGEVGDRPWQGVVYKVSSFTAGQLDKQFEDFLQAKSDALPDTPVSGLDEGEAPQ